jgi:hypothetical protein
MLFERVSEYEALRDRLKFFFRDCYTADGGSKK